MYRRTRTGAMMPIIAVMAASTGSHAGIFPDDPVNHVVSGTWVFATGDFVGFLPEITPGGGVDLEFEAEYGEGSEHEEVPLTEWEPLTSTSEFGFRPSGEDPPGTSLAGTTIVREPLPDGSSETSASVIELSQTVRGYEFFDTGRYTRLGLDRGSEPESIDLRFSIVLIGSTEAITVDPFPRDIDFSEITSAELTVQTLDMSSVAIATIDFASLEVVPAPSAATIAGIGLMGLTRRSRR